MKIFIGIPSIRQYEPFWNSMNDFIPRLRKECEVEISIVKDKSIEEARNIIVSKFIESNCDYLLFLDDDHSGHTIEMFDAILDPIVNNNSYMCAIKCHAKYFPYASNIAIYSNINEDKLGIEKGLAKYIPVDLEEGYMYVDLVGFGMTLLSRMCFIILEEPFFLSVNNSKEDNYFCDKLVNSGIQPVGCFKYTLDHGGIGIHNVKELKEKEIIRLKQKHPDLKAIVA